MGKKLTLVGPKESGKTCFAYLLKYKLFDRLYDPKNRESYIQKGYESDILQRINDGLWVEPTKTKTKQVNTLTLECIVPWFLWFSKRTIIKMPDISAEKYSEMLEIAKRHEINSTQYYETSTSHQPYDEVKLQEVKKVADDLKKSHAYIFLSMLQP